MFRPEDITEGKTSVIGEVKREDTYSLSKKCEHPYEGMFKMLLGWGEAKKEQEKVDLNTC